MNKKDNKISKLEEEIIRHKKCLREKDRRLTKIEERFNLFKKTTTGIVIFIMAIVSIMLPIYFAVEYTETFMNFLMWFGVYMLIAMLGTIVLFLAFCWNDEFDVEFKTNFYVSFIISAVIAFLITVIIAINVYSSGAT